MTSSSVPAKEDKKAAAGAINDDDEAIMEYKLRRPLKADELNNVKAAVTVKLSDLMGESCDEVFPEYITVMIGNGKTIREISSQLEDLLTATTATMFCKWLGKHLQGVEAAAATAAAHKKASSKADKAKSKRPSSPGDGGDGPNKSRSGASGHTKKSKSASSKVAGSKGKSSRDYSRSRSRSRSTYRSASRSRSRSGSFSRSRSISSSRSYDRERGRVKDSRDRGGRDSRNHDWERSRNGDHDRRRNRSRDSRDRGRDGFRDVSGYSKRSRDDSRELLRDRGNNSYRNNGNRGSGLDRYGPDPRVRDHYARRGSPRGESRERNRFRARDGSFSTREKKESSFSTRDKRDSSFSSREKRDSYSTKERDSRDPSKVVKSGGRSPRENRDNRADGGKEKGFAALAESGRGGRGKRTDGEKEGAKEEKEEKETGDRAKQAMRAEPKSSVSMTASASGRRRSEQPAKPVILGSISVVGGSAKEELEKEKERAKLPDLRTIILERRRAAEVAAAAAAAATNGANDEIQTAHEQQEAEQDIHQLKGRNAEGSGAMRGFSPDSPGAQSQKVKAGVKRGLGTERNPGARLLSSAMLQSVQSVGIRLPAEGSISVVAGAGNDGGDKRRKSGDGTRYVKTTASGKVLREPDVNDNNGGHGQSMEERAEDNRAPHEGGNLRISNPSAFTTKASKARQEQQTTGRRHEIQMDPTWQSGQGGADDAVDDDQLEGANGGYFAHDCVDGEEQQEPEEELLWGQKRSVSSHQQQQSPTAYFTARQRAARTNNGNNNDGPWDVDSGVPLQKSNSFRSDTSSTAAAGNGNAGVSTSNKGNMTWTNPKLLEQKQQQQQQRQRQPSQEGGGANWTDWANSIQTGSQAGTPSDTASKWATAIRSAAAANGNSSPAAQSTGGVTVVSEESLALLASLSAEEAVAAAGFGAQQSTFRGRGGRALGAGRNASWIRGGRSGSAMRGRGRGRVSRGGRGVRGRVGATVPARSLGRGGGWHSTGAAGSDGGRGRGVGARGGVPRETWNKVWVRPDVSQQGREGDAAGGGEVQASSGDT